MAFTSLWHVDKDGCRKRLYAEVSNRAFFYNRLCSVRYLQVIMQLKTNGCQDNIRIMKKKMIWLQVRLHMYVPEGRDSNHACVWCRLASSLCSTLFQLYRCTLERQDNTNGTQFVLTKHALEAKVVWESLLT